MLTINVFRTGFITFHSNTYYQSWFPSPGSLFCTCTCDSNNWATCFWWPIGLRCSLLCQNIIWTHLLSVFWNYSFEIYLNNAFIQHATTGMDFNGIYFPCSQYLSHPDDAVHLNNVWLMTKCELFQSVEQKKPCRPAQSVVVSSKATRHISICQAHLNKIK